MATAAPDLMGDPGPAEAMVRRAVEEEREACCRDVCWFCREGYPLALTTTSAGTVFHDVSALRGAGQSVPCDAAAIRRRGA